MNRPSTVGLLLVAAVCCAPAVRAGQACDQTAADPQAVSRGMALAVATAQALDASGAQVVMLARAGQDLSAYQLTYSHLGFERPRTSCSTTTRARSASRTGSRR